MHVDIKLLTIDSRIHILFKCALGSEGLEFLILQGSPWTRQWLYQTIGCVICVELWTCPVQGLTHEKRIHHPGRDSWLALSEGSPAITQ